MSGASVIFVLAMFGCFIWTIWGLIKPKFHRLGCFIKYYFIKRPSINWYTRKSIYNQIKHNKKDSDQRLVDDKPIKENEWRFAYGMSDIVYNSDAKEIETLVKKLSPLIKKYHRQAIELPGQSSIK